MRVSRIILTAVMLGAVLWAFGASRGFGQGKSAPEIWPPEKGDHVHEVRAMLTALTVGEPRSYKSMIVFPIHYRGRQAPGDWETMDEAVEAGHLRILEKEQAAVSDVRMENTSDATIFLMSGEIIKGGKQTRVIRSDTIIDARQKVTVPVFCVERHRWHGKVEFQSSANYAPSSINRAIKGGANQREVWSEVETKARSLGVQSSTGSLDEVLDSDEAGKEFDALHQRIGKFSPSGTVGIAIADTRTGRVIGLEVFGRRDLFENLQDKLLEGYAADVVLARHRPQVETDVTGDEVMDFIRLALSGASNYENTPGSGRGIDLRSGAVRGKGVALGETAIHLSIQRMQLEPVPAKPIIDDRPRPLPMPQIPRVR